MGKKIKFEITIEDTLKGDSNKSNTNKEKISSKFKKIKFRNKIPMFEDLKPKNDKEDIESKEALDFIFKNKNIHNIGITGNYSAGKSSILESYIKKYGYSKKHIVNISLATFQNKKISKRKLQELEKEIVEQLYYSVYNYERIKKLLVSIIGALCITLSIILFCRVFFSENFINFFQTNKIKKILFVYLLLLLELTCVFIKLYEKSKFSIKISDIEAKFDNTSKDKSKNIFNENLSFIFKIFSTYKSRLKIIIFEDLDRFENPIVFEDLKKLNYLLNENLKKRILFNTKANIKFIYVLKDEIMSTENRTKFFDFIYPVVPFVSYFSSGDALNKLISEKYNLQDELPSEFISSISLFVQDMRILKNTLNEYRIYRKEVDRNPETNEKSGMYYKKLFSIILYKNIFSEDFAKLQRLEGKLVGIFTKKKFIEDLEVEIEKECKSKNKKEIKEKKEKLERLKNNNISKLIKENDISLDEFNIFDNNLEKENVRKKELVIFLLRKEYIDENYSLYINKSYNESIKDINFKRNVLIDNGNSFMDFIDHPRIIINSLEEEYFMNKNSLNLYILKEMLEPEMLVNNKNKYDIYISNFINSNELIENLQLCKNFFSLEEKEKLYNILGEDGIKNFLNKYITNYNELLIEISCLINKEHIADYNENTRNKFKQRIENCSEILNLKNEEYFKTLCKLFEILKIKMKKIDTNEKEISKIRDYVIKNNMYELNIENIKFVVEQNGMLYKPEESYTQISRIVNVKKYVDSNIKEYLKNIFFKCKSHNESENAIIMLLNNKKVKLEDAKRIIEMESKKRIIQNVGNIKSTNLYSDLFKYNVVVANYNNVRIFYNKDINCKYAVNREESIKILKDFCCENKNDFDSSTLNNITKLTNIVL